MTKQIATVNTQAVVGHFTQTELDTLKGTIAKGTSNEQFALFVQTCVSSGLNPFLNQVYCIVYNGKDGPVMSIQIAVEGIVALAKRNPHYKGFIASEVKEHDEFEIDVVTGEPVHKIKTLQRGKTIGAYCVAYRDGTPNVAVIITTDQVEHLVKGRNGQMWKDFFDDMIVKHAIKRAFKRQFGIEVAEDEYIGADSSSGAPESYVRRDITAEANEVAENRNEIQPPAASQVNEMAQVRQQISTAFRELGVVGKEAQAEYMKANCKVAGDKPTLDELKGLLNYMRMEIAEQAAGDDDLE
ncbi:recombinase RecT [Paenibacillus sp. N4]|uniref:RecT family recombinase n=1 Tax=Paenibacillus vietnamensis TaxID=2590547 RepID=UPI001CD13138|nr:RecT family recombinase [Paenibacillus vietnamensis]MCA0754870.1 recombinase RecT [Paenibacillus vietnamensis]